jgi:hypothetical protein
VLSAFQECLPGEIEQEFLRGEFLGVGLAVGWVARPTAGRNPEL